MGTPSRTESPQTTEKAQKGGGKPQKKGPRALLARENRRLLYGLIIGALVALFAVLNLERVDVNWIFGTWRTPLIIVIAVSFLLGACAGWIADAQRHRR
jgi:uncharacterized integral membrane protein